MRDSLFTVLGMTMALSLSASAEWQVRDEGTRNKLDTANKHLERIEQVGSGSYQSDAEAGSAQGQYKAPDIVFKSEEVTMPANASKKLSRVEMTIEDRCPKPKRLKLPGGDGGGSIPIPSDSGTAVTTPGIDGNGADSGKTDIGTRQWHLCKDIVETQIAQFKYNVMMSELAAKRYERLRELQQARSKIDGNAAGLLQDNTNAILGLIAQTQIDQQQHKAYNDAYQARLTYLSGVQERLTQMAMAGSQRTGREIAGDVAMFATMAAGLGVNPFEKMEFKYEERDYRRRK
ncbi:hypothetical protein EBB59_13240 [Lysobacter pythonis]|uniref:Uncharacterized protein n=1 Tax=Solilutibacter pythonis TaxID=2483112 RepID=A0A3M2HIB1_9GAMM|nr:hypothetical protein EBB59_13240 [Lysobacter pythonis]